MKFTNLIFSLTFFITVYAQAESTPQVESTSQTESTSQAESMPVVPYNQEKTGFYSVSIGGEAIPLDNLTNAGFFATITFGATLSKRSSFEGGIKLVETNGGLLFRYGYSFKEGRHWVPGVDVTLLVSAHQLSYPSEKMAISGGFELGPYLKTFISHSHSLFIRTGVTHYAVVGEYFDIAKFRMYLNLGVKFHF